MTSEGEATGHAIFQTWNMYSIIIRENYMRHAEMTSSVARTAASISHPLRVVDAGCGDGWLAWNALRHVPVQSYLGIDLSAAALEEARSRLPIGSGCAESLFEFTCEDLRTALPAVASNSVNFVLASYSLHHVSQTEKLALLSEIRRMLVPGGVFLWTDVVRCQGQSRDEYLTLLEQEVRQNWNALSGDDIERAIAHIFEADFPEEVEWMTSTASQLGLQPSPPLFRDAFFGCWSFTAQ